MFRQMRLPDTTRWKRLLATVAIGGALLVLPSCAIPHLRDSEPEPCLPSAFDITASSGNDDHSQLETVYPMEATRSDDLAVENSADLNPVDFFQDATLAGLIDGALADNRELKILSEEVQVANSEVLAARGTYLPFVRFIPGVEVDKPSRYTVHGAVEDQLEPIPGVRFPDPRPNFRFGFNILWDLDVWRELRNARDAAFQRYLAACEKRDYFVTQLISEVAESYYTLMALDMQIQTLDGIITLQEQSLKVAQVRMEAARDTQLAVKRFEAEVRKNQSEKLIVKQQIIEAENRINFLINRYPQPVERDLTKFLDLTINSLHVGLPAQLLEHRPDIRQAERELAAAGLDVLVARARFYPRVALSAGVGYEAFNPTYLLRPDALMYNVGGELIAPVINWRAIRAEYFGANAKQLQAVYSYQRVVLNAFTEVVNRLSKVRNYETSLAIKRQQLQALESSVNIANLLFQNARVEYMDVLMAQRDLLEAQATVIDTKREQLGAVVQTYQALGGGSGNADGA